MTPIIVTVTVTVILARFLAPRMFTRFDRRTARARLAPRATNEPTDSRRRAHRQSAEPMKPHEVCDLLAAAVLSGEPPRDALAGIVSGQRVPGTLGAVCTAHLESPEPFGSVMQHVRNDLAATELHELGVLLSLCVVDGVLVPVALKHAAELLRHEESLERLTATHTAHARITMRVLSMLPVGFLAVGALVSKTFGSAVVTRAGLVCLLLSMVLNFVGRWWASRLIASVGAPDDDTDAALLVMGIGVSMHTGHSVMGACLNLRDLNECGRRVAGRLDAHDSLESALEELAPGGTGDALRQMILDSARSGLPVRQSADRLAQSVRQRRAASVATRAQQLATTLSMPIVLCMLPSFGLAALMPLLIASMSSLAASA